MVAALNLALGPGRLLTLICLPYEKQFVQLSNETQ
jgi:hypothetical protein